MTAQRQVQGRSLALILAAFAAAPGLSGQQSVSSFEGDYLFGGVTYPSVADTFRVMAASRWMDPELGVGLTFAAMGFPAELTIYVYPADQGLDAEFADALGEIETYAASNREGVNLEVEGRESVRVTATDGNEYSGHLGNTVMRQGTSSTNSLLYVFEKDGWFVKYRISYERAMVRLMEPRIETFLSETLGSIGVPIG